MLTSRAFPHLHGNRIDEEGEKPVEGDQLDLDAKGCKVLVEVWDLCDQHLLENSLFESRNFVRAATL